MKDNSKVKLTQSIATKLTAAFVIMLTIIVICCAVGWNSARRLSNEITFITSKVYVAATSILATDGLNHREDKYIERTLVDVDDTEWLAVIEENAEMLKGHYESALATGVLSDATLEQIDDQVQVNARDVDNVMASDIAFRESYDTYSKTLTDFVQFLTELNANADGAVTRLSAASDGTQTWNAELDNAWKAKEGAKRSLIALYKRAYALQCLVSGQDREASLTRIDEGRAELAQGAEMALAGAFGEYVVKTGPYSGRTAQEAMTQLSAAMSQHGTATVAIYDEREQFKAAYRQSTRSLADAYRAGVADAGTIAEEAEAHAAALTRSITWTIIATLIVGVIVAIAATIFAIRTIVRPIGVVVERLQDIAEGEGDLTRRLDLVRADELGKLAFWFNTFVARIHDTVRRVAENTHTLSASSEQAKVTSSDMAGAADGMSNQSTSAAAATEQASANIKNVAAAIEEISVNSGNVSSSADKVSNNLTSVGSAVEEMSVNMTTIASSVEEMSASVNTIAAAVEEMSSSLTNVSANTTEAAGIAQTATEKAHSTAETVNRLGSSAKEIDKVVDLITGIAEQTNLLALNATIEAASAGEAGKGFAVVANEVKELAKQTAGATQEIRMQVEGMQQNTNEAVTAIRGIVEVIAKVNEVFGVIAAAVNEQTTTVNEISRSVADAATGGDEISRNVQEVATGAQSVSRSVQEAIESVNSIAQSVNELALGANEIARNAAEASQGMTEVSTNVQAVNSSAQKTRKGADEMSTAANEMADLATDLQKLVGSFAI